MLDSKFTPKLAKKLLLSSHIPWVSVLTINASFILKIIFAYAVNSKYHKELIVGPPNLHKELYTIGAIDNLDHNPSS